MTGVRPVLFLRSGLHHQCAPAILQHRFGDIHPKYATGSILSAQSVRVSPSRDTLRNTASWRSFSPKPSSICFLRIGARSLAPFGPPESPGLNKQLLAPSVQLRTLEKEFLCAYKPTSVPAAILQSGSSSWITAILIGLATGAILSSVRPVEVGYKQSLEASNPDENLDESNSHRIEDYSKMTGEAQPGRPGTLTAEQEEKLREFWVAVLQVFGVIDPKESNGNGHTELGNSTPRSDTSLSSKKPKKKRISLFRKKDSDDADSVTSTESSGHHVVGEADDKYGQTKEFHDALASQSPESLRTTFWSMVKHDHPDALLLRFLRARKWDVEKALVMMVSTMRWRSTEMHVDDDIMKNGELAAFEDSQGSDPAKKKVGEDFLTQMRLGKSFLHGLDKENRPMCFVRARLHRQGEQSEESLERYTVFVIESARMILSPPVDTACIIFDLTGFSMANMDYAPVKFMIKCFEANYPESLGVVLVHKAPWIFQGIWKIIKGWLDPVVASKVHFTNNNSEMEVFVPASNIINELAGSEDWSYKYIEPVPGENDKMKDTETRDKLLTQREGIVDEYEKLTVEWIHGEGDIDGVKKKRHEIAGKLSEDYWRLDPYIRARSYYDRVGLINEGGRLQFYKGRAVETVPAANGTKPVETSADDID